MEMASFLISGRPRYPSRAPLWLLAGLALSACGGGGGGGGGGPPPNQPPVLGAIGPRTVAEGATLTINLTTTDADGNTVTYDTPTLPAFITFVAAAAGTAELRVAPTFSDSGSYALTVRVRDTAGATDEETFTLTVTDVPVATNRPPVLATIPPQTLVTGQVQNIALSATDPDGDGMSLSATGLPAFATLTDGGGGNGNLRLSPGPSDAGSYSLTIRVTDTGTPSLADTETFTVTVTAGVATTNQVALENQLPGTSSWRLTNPAELRQIEGFASATSVNRGSNISLYVNTAAATFQLEVFRMGWYQGLGARRVFGPVQVAGTTQTVPSPNGSTGLVDANWTNPYVLDTETGGEPWRTGVYLAKLTTEPAGKQSYIIFVVRDDSHTPEVLFTLPVTTYQSYNAWGGKSLYPTQSGSQQPWGSTSGNRAVKVSFNRPYAASVAPAAWYGMGAGEFITNTQPVFPATTNYPISAAGWDYNMVRWLEQEQYDVGYVTNIDVHRTNAGLANVEVILSPGHDEYWSWQMFDNIEAARDSGVDLAFFSANTAYRQIRFEASPFSAGSPEQSARIMVHYREVPDPILSDGNSFNDYLASIEFRTAPVSRPEQNLIGVQYVQAPVDADIVVTNASHSLFAGTGVSNGSRFVGLLGYEVDMRFGGLGSVTELAQSPFNILSPPYTAGISQMTIYRAGSGAEVFATGSIQWSWGLDDFNGPGQGGLRPARLSAAAQQLTDNVLERFGATPYVPNPVRAECVQLRALSNATGNPSWASAAEIDLLGPDGRELSKSGWTIAADSQEAANPATQAIDGNVGTFWHSQFSGGAPLLPHTLTIDVGTAAIDISALRYLPRQDSSLNGTIGAYEVHTSPTCAAPSWTRVASGSWLETPTGNAGRKTARFLR